MLGPTPPIDAPLPLTSAQANALATTPGFGTAADAQVEYSAASTKTKIALMWLINYILSL